MKKSWLSFFPLVGTAVVLAATWMFVSAPSVKQGIAAGILIALALTFASGKSLQWALNKPFFYWVWGGGVLVRLFVFAATAFVVYRFTALSLVATMVTLALATTVFLVTESAALPTKQ